MGDDGPDDEEQLDDSPINQEDCWEVISAYFEEKGLVRQQLDSFDAFIMNTIQEIVDECSTLHLIPQQQHNPLHQTSGARSYKITFGQIYLSKKPEWVEPDQSKIHTPQRGAPAQSDVFLAAPHGREALDSEH